MGQNERSAMEGPKSAFLFSAKRYIRPYYFAQFSSVFWHSAFRYRILYDTPKIYYFCFETMAKWTGAQWNGARTCEWKSTRPHHIWLYYSAFYDLAFHLKFSSALSKFGLLPFGLTGFGLLLCSQNLLFYYYFNNFSNTTSPLFDQTTPLGVIPRSL